MSIEKGVTRSDFGQLAKPVRTPAGFLRADGYLTRAGIFQYRQPDGTTRHELRPAEEVFHADSVKSFAMAPVTDDHPPTNLTADNAREYMRGSVSENLKQDGMMLRGGMMVTDADLIAKMERGDSAQVSCGYTCDVEMTPGVWQGQKYDAVQRNIRGNHVAIVPRGRAGDGVRVRMDARDAAMVFDPGGATAPTQEQPRTMKTFRHDGVSYEGSEQVAELVEKLQKERADSLGAVDAVKKEAATAFAKLEAKHDAAVAELATVKADAAKAPERIRAEIQARMGLEQGARQVLGKAAKFDGLSDREVRVAVLKKIEPKFDVAPKSDEYVAARFDIAIEATKNDTTSAISAARESVEVEHADGAEGEEKMDAAEKNALEMRNLWKQPIGRNVTNQ